MSSRPAAEPMPTMGRSWSGLDAWLALVCHLLFALARSLKTLLDTPFNGLLNLQKPSPSLQQF